MVKAREYQMKPVSALGYHQDLQQVATKDLPLFRWLWLSCGRVHL